jgi:uncharacterized protein YcbX
MEVGSVAQTWRYPVKSMAGEALASARVAPDLGIDGDRAFALIDVATGAVASGKHPRKWAQLLACKATLDETRSARIELPDGTRLESSEPDVDQRLSATLGRAVRLSSTPPRQAKYEEYDAAHDSSKAEPLAVGAGTGTFFDFAPIHFVTTATLARLQELLPESRIDRARFRPNLVIDTRDARGFVENEWIGRVIAIGSEVQICAVFTCPRCVMTTLAQPELPADPAILRAASEHNKQWFPLLAKKLPTVGMYATVVRGGTIRTGDAVRLEGVSPLRRLGAAAHAVKRAIRRR